MADQAADVALGKTERQRLQQHPAGDGEVGVIQRESCAGIKMFVLHRSCFVQGGAAPPRLSG